MANIEFKTLEQFMPYWCQKILPAVYDDSLSYYQLLGRILQKYNEVIEIVNKHSETLIDHENRITAAEAQIELNRQAIEALKAELAKLDEQVKQNTTNIATLTERVNGHDEDIEQINTWINNASTFLLVNHRAIIDPSTHDMKLQLFNTMFPQWTDWYDVVINGGDSWTIMSGTSLSDKAIGVLSMTPGRAGQFVAFGAMVEDNDLHYFTATYSRQGSAANLGGTDNWKEVELLDITNIKQSLGDGEYDTISQKVLTQLINSKLNHDMGITGATAGQYINIATVDSEGKPLTYGFGTPGGGGTGVDIVQTTGQSTTSVMSQKATTDAINAVKTNADAGATAANQIAVSVVYPTTSAGTNGKFVGKDGTTLTRTQLLATLIGADGKNTIFTVKKTGATSWDRIMWFKASAGEGIYDFAWYETDGTNAKAGVDRLTMASNGQFAVSERESVDLGGGGGIDISLGVTGASVDDFIQVSGVSGGKPTGWKKISVTDMSALVSRAAYDLGADNNTKPIPAASEQEISVDMPAAWVGKTRQQVIDLLATGEFVFTVSSVYQAYGVTESVTVYCRNSYKISEADTSSTTAHRTYVTGAAWGDYETYNNVNKRRMKISYTALSTTLTSRVTSTDKLTVLISSTLRND